MIAGKAEAYTTRVLVVEDEWLLALDYAQNLVAAGMEVVGPAPTASKAMALLEADGIDVALLDIRLGDGDSIPVADELVSRGIPFVFVSGFTSLELPDRLSGTTVLSKPVPPKVLQKALSQALEDGKGILAERP